MTLDAGVYVLAVSGGVDSMVLLDLLAGQSGLQLTVAHFDHGIRPDSAEDRLLVQAAAAARGLPFVYEEGRLEPDTSEAAARAARYAFLERVCAEQRAHAIVTAHHQDDLLETMLLNVMRGTGRRGLASLRSNGRMLRPLLALSKSELLAYARERQLAWREDSTNRDTKYRRNFLRRTVMSHLSEAQRRNLLRINRDMRTINEEIDVLVAEWLAAQPNTLTIDRRAFSALPHIVAREVMAEFARRAGIADIDRQLIERLVVAGKTARAGTQHDADASHMFLVDRTTLEIAGRQR